MYNISFTQAYMGQDQNEEKDQLSDRIGRREMNKKIN